MIFVLQTFLLQLVLSSNTQVHQFEADVGRLMDIIINSLYTEKQIFLRELISNASDALDKIRFLSISDPLILGQLTQLEIKINFDPQQKSVTILDNGIGMTKQDLIQNLGTVAKSGTTSFLQAIKGGDVNLIGQFGVGFYSSFLAASKVQVISKHNRDEQYVWQSEAGKTFKVYKDQSNNKLGRGTSVKLFLKEDAYQFCQYSTLQNFIKKYSSFINFPIYLKKIVDKVEKTDKTDEEWRTEVDQMIEKKKNQLEKLQKEITQEDIEEIQNSVNHTKQIKIPTITWERVNQQKALWMRDKYQIQDNQYKQFFKLVFRDYNQPSAWTHFKTQGQVSFTGLLFVPERAPMDLLNKLYEKKNQLKLYVRRVLINEQFEDLLPKYLNFIQGIVDSDELPLNVNRNNLQQAKLLKSISSKLLRKVILMLESFNPQNDDQQQDIVNEVPEQDLEEDSENMKTLYQKKKEKFNKFLDNYQKNIKLGIIDDSQHKERLAALTRWYTSFNVLNKISFNQYINRMQDGQQVIYYLGGQNRNILKQSPLIQKLVHNGYQVILGDDSLDQSVMYQLGGYKNYKIVNVARIDFKDPAATDQTRRENKALKKQLEPLIDFLKTQLKDEIKDVKISNRLVQSPVVVVADIIGQTPNSQRISYGNTLNYHKSQNMKILQINPHHPTIQQLHKRVVQQIDEEQTSRMVNLMYRAGLIHSGYILTDPSTLTNIFRQMMNSAVGLQEGDQIEEIVVTEQMIQKIQSKQKKKQKKQKQQNNEKILQEEERQYNNNKIEEQQLIDQQDEQDEQQKDNEKIIQNKKIDKHQQKQIQLNEQDSDL